MIERVAAELEIRNLLARLAQLADTGPLDEYLSKLTEDVVWEMPDNPNLGLPATRRRGHDEVAAGVRERTAAGHQGEGADSRHVVTTSWIRVDGNEAVSDSYFLFYGATSTQPELRSMGRYHDTFRCTDDGWKLAHRTITFG